VDDDGVATVVAADVSWAAIDVGVILNALRALGDGRVPARRAKA
jgi:hypothetical protein